MVRYFALLVFINIYFFAYTQSSNVSLLGNWDDNSLLTESGLQYNDIWGYSNGGKEFAIIGSRQKVIFLDITDPSSITEIAAITPGGNSTWRDMKTFGNYAYAVADRGSEGLLTFDLSDIDDPVAPDVTLVNQQTSRFTQAHNIFIDTDHGFLYVAGANASGADLIIYDLNSTPSNPSHLETVNLPGNYIHDVYVKDHVAYCSHGNNGLFVYNLCGITDAPCPDGVDGTFLELGRLDVYTQQGYNHSSWAKGDHFIFADETHGHPLRMVDASDFTDMQIIDEFQSNQLGIPNPSSSSGSIPHNPFILGNLCVVSYYHDGIVFYNISDPENVIEVGYYDTAPTTTDYASFEGCWGVYPFLPSGRIIASDDLNGLFVLGMSNSLQALTILPVTWKNINAEAEGNTVHINWATHEEADNKGFWVQRKDETGQFVNLSFVSPNAHQTYVFLDNDPLFGKNFYRIAQEDYDGTINYSTIVTAVYQAERIHWQVSPNPVISGSVIQIEATQARPFSFNLFDSRGRWIQSYQKAEPAKIHTLALPKLPAGVYILQNVDNSKIKIIVK